VLQEKQFRPLGATESRRADFRVISATNRDLSTEIRCGRFRSDLYYRLKVITLRLPPLRERKEDIPLLVEHFLSRYGDGRPVSPEVMQILGSYDWPGNIRELENSIYAMTALGRGESLGVVDLPEELRGVAAQWQTTQRRKSPYYQDYGNANGPSFPLVPLAEVERLVIIRALRFTHGDCTRTAAILHIGRTTLYRKLREYHVPMEKAPRAVQRDWQAGLDPALPSEVGFFRSLPAGELIVQFSPMAPVPSSAPDPLTLLILEPIEVRFPSRLVLPATATATTGTAAATVAL
jgi:two-component system response regulator HydG